jgi:alpha-tubulin suppressor-like RCC1 family protein
MRLIGLCLGLVFILPGQIQQPPSQSFGDGATRAEGPTVRSTPTQVDGLAGVVALAAAAALISDGTVWTWTTRLSSDGTTMVRSTPTQVDGLTGVVAMAEGVALKNDGTVWDFDGPQPLQVSGLSDVVAIDQKWGTRVAVKGDGTVWAWRLGHISPAFQVRPATGVVAIAACAFGALVLKADGTVWMLGLADYDETSSTTSVWYQMNGLSEIVAIDGSYDAALAVKSDGTVWNIDSPTSVQVKNLTAAVRVAVGRRHCLVLMDNGNVWEWGHDYVGPGYTVRTTWPTPRPVVGLTGVVGIAAEDSHSFALRADGTVWAWEDEQSY